MTERQHRILIVDNDRAIQFVLAEALRDEGYDIMTADNGRDALASVEKERFAVVIMDIMMPVLDGLSALRMMKDIEGRPEVIIMTAHTNMENTVEAMKLGAFDYMVKPFDIDDIISLTDRAVEKYRQRETSSSAPVQDAERIIGDSPRMRELYKLLGRLASTDSSVLITGETGTGKDLFARAIHYHSARREKPFITVNCSSIPGELLESELFGHVRGAFTGATDRRRGKCELANNGTLFLDEIGTMRLDLQAKILTFLQRSEFEPVGSVETIKVNVRVIAATNAELSEMVRRSEFREDLYYRLMVVPVSIPPLRERREDIPDLAKYFVERYNSRYDLSFALTQDSIRSLAQRDWPGNVRELENYIHRLVVLQPDDSGGEEHFGLSVPERHTAESLDAAVSELLNTGGADLLEMAHELIERPLIERLMIQVTGNQTEAARRLGVSRNTLRKLLMKFGKLS